MDSIKAVKNGNSSLSRVKGGDLNSSNSSVEHLVNHQVHGNKFPRRKCNKYIPTSYANITAPKKRTTSMQEKILLPSSNPLMLHFLDQLIQDVLPFIHLLAINPLHFLRDTQTPFCKTLFQHLIPSLTRAPNLLDIPIQVDLPSNFRGLGKVA